MPSNHAQFMGFFCAYFALFLYIRLNQKSCCRETKGLIFLIFLLLTVVVCYSRVYLLYHTFSQVLVGVTVGGVSAVIWFLLVQHIVTPIFPWISDSWIGHLLMLQDFTHINNIVKFEYINAQNHIRRTKFERPM
ncbi:unnamed protein product [Heterobilharzia americana]|nr:unnamed protein product [Heterobilharzia americana]